MVRSAAAWTAGAVTFVWGLRMRLTTGAILLAAAHLLAAGAVPDGVRAILVANSVVGLWLMQAHATSYERVWSAVLQRHVSLSRTQLVVANIVSHAVLPALLLAAPRVASGWEEYAVTCALPAAYVIIPRLRRSYPFRLRATHVLAYALVWVTIFVQL
jgi:hypothetical protein